jgi:repressor LexA
VKNITEKQKYVLKFIEDFTEENGYPPTMREIGKRFEFSAKAAFDFVNALKKKSYIKTENNCSRAIKVIKSLREADSDFVEIPVAGDVAAGIRMLSEENYNGAVLVHKSWIKHKDKQYFALIVRGDSMIGAGIMDGDTAIIIKQETARNGEIVVAEVDEGYTLKRYYKENSRVRLEPENPCCKTVYCRNVRIAGILAGVYRQY